MSTRLDCYNNKPFKINKKKSDSRSNFDQIKSTYSTLDMVHGGTHTVCYCNTSNTIGGHVLFFSYFDQIVLSCKLGRNHRIFIIEQFYYRTRRIILARSYPSHVMTHSNVSQVHIGFRDSSIK